MPDAGGDPGTPAPRDEGAPGARDGHGVGRRAARISAATMLSRVGGLIRESLLTALFGAEALSDAFRIAFKIPNLARDLFAEGALSSAFVPTFTDALRNDGKERAFAVANVVIGALLVVVGAIVLVAEVFAPGIVDVFGFAGEQRDLTITATRILLPFLPIVSLAAVAMGQLNAQERYTAPALAPVTFNVIAIACGVFLLAVDAPPRAAFLGWTGATLLGGLGQLLVQVPALRRTGFRFRPRLDWGDPALVRIRRLMGPAVFGLAATNVNVLVTAVFAARIPGAVTWLEVAFRMIYLPIGVFAVAIATVTTTRLAHGAADRDVEGMTHTLTTGLRLVAFLTVPCTVGLIVLRTPILRLLFERRSFLASDTAATADALAMYALGLFAYSAVKVVAPAFYALDRPRVPLAASFSAVGVNVALAFALVGPLGHRGLALATAIGAFVNIAVLLVVFGRSVRTLPAGHAHRARRAGRRVRRRVRGGRVGSARAARRRGRDDARVGAAAQRGPVRRSGHRRVRRPCARAPPGRARGAGGGVPKAPRSEVVTSGDEGRGPVHRNRPAAGPGRGRWRWRP